MSSVPPAPTGPALLTPADVDALVEAMWQAAGATPAAAAGDAEFLRRVTLDAVGRVPTLDEAERFLANGAPDKRARLVDALLASPEHADHAAGVAMDLLVGRQFRKPRLEKRLDPRAFFVEAFRANRPWDAMARDMLTFTGEILPSGAGVYLASHLRGGGPEAATAATARLFLGVQIQCAQCHDHPTDARYKQEDFYGLVAYFGRTRAREEKIEGAPPMSGADGKRYFVVEKPGAGKRVQAKFKPPGMGMGGEERVAAPRFFGRDIEPLRNETPRETLARAVTGSELFAKAAVDRTWTELFGRGIVEPWDDLGGEGDPSHPALLVRLADDFRASGYDLRHLLRILLLSRAYGLTSRSAPDAPDSAPAPFARAAVRRLSPEQLFRSLLVATGADRAAPGGAADDEVQKKIDRALREYLYVFGDDEMAEVETFNGNIPQALLLFNGDVTNQGTRARPGSTLAALLAATPDPAQRLRRLYLTAYARPPSDDEAARLLPALAASTGPAAWEDVFFALLTSTEMLTNH